MQEQYEQLMDLFHQIKEAIRRADRHTYERWKAGGFRVDDDIVSMYPSLGEIIHILEEEEEEFEDEDE